MGSTTQTCESKGRAGSREVPAPDPELDGNDLDPIAICGFSIKFPQDATSPEAFWKMMVERRCAMTGFPRDRLNPDGFYQEDNRLNTLPVKGGYFIEEDMSAFDADFFSISPTEATAMDPMQRWLLETAYRALENAGIPMESISGSSTGVYTGSFSLDYLLHLGRDAECPPTYAAVGFGLSMLANRLSWFFNLHGPSIGLDSACSSTAMAIDIACQALRSGSCSMSMVAGCNMASAPEPFLWMSNLNFLSPDGRCYSFDERANGYARGEGIGVIILKRLSDAIRDGNTIRAVIRSTGSNEDGRTPGITQPSQSAQEKLIRETYRKAGLSMSHTRFFEAHGTGTAIGDPREAQAIGSAFREYRSKEDPVYVGALKSNIGHLEGASGLAGIIKAVLILEKGIIPPNTNFQKINPRIDADYLKLKFPTESCPWPTQGLRRASVNSFGYGGSNSHVVLDDAYNYLRLRSLPGKHCTVPSPPQRGSTLEPPRKRRRLMEPEPIDQEDELPRLLVWSAADKDGLRRIANAYQEWYDEGYANQVTKDKMFLRNLAYTLDSHRSHLPWRSFAIVQSPRELHDLKPVLSSPLRKRTKSPRLGFVFSGQGAQWFAMGRELLMYSSFKEELETAGKYLTSLGCRWPVLDELLKPKETSRIDNPEYSQTLCTVLQVALVNLLRKFNVRPSAVVGHSSGEIAAAYAGGYLSRESAWKVAYFRGICSAELATASCKTIGSMMSVGLSEISAREFVSAINQNATDFGLAVACVNSPTNVTISGEDRLIDQLKARLDEQKVFARKLRVNLAYHSRQMDKIADKYASMMGALPKARNNNDMIPMISSVTGERATRIQLNDPAYWVANMTSSVLFSQAVSNMCKQSEAHLTKKIDQSHLLASVVDHLLEVGPHAVLQGPIRDILRKCPRGESIGYTSVLRRDRSAMTTMLSAIGELHCMGVHVDLREVNEPSGAPSLKAPRSLLVNLPEYQFDHSQNYWHESRLSRNYRLREHAPTELLGVRAKDWNRSEPRWRHYIRTTEMPWAEQHVVNGTILYPGAGMLVMAIEAAKQLVAKDVMIAGYTLRDVHLEGPMDLTRGAGTLEVQTSLRELMPHSKDNPSFEFFIRTHTNEDWLLNAHGYISVEFTKAPDHWTLSKHVSQQQALAQNISEASADCEELVDTQGMYSFLKRYGYEYGPLFQVAKQQRCNRRQKQAAAEVSLFSSSQEEHVVHPVSLDAILHICFTAFTAGGVQPMATSIPSRIGSLWLSNTGLSRADDHSVTSVTACTTVTNVTQRGFYCSGGAVDSGNAETLRLWYEDLELTNVTSAPALTSHINPKQFCMNIDSQVALDKLDSREIVSLLNTLHPEQEDLSSFFRDLELLIEISLDKLVNTIDSCSLKNKELWARRYLEWAQYHLQRSYRNRAWDDPTSHIQATRRSFHNFCERIRNTNHVGKIYVEVALNLEAMLKNEASPLELLMKSGLLKNYYEELTGYRCSIQVAKYMDLLAHQQPGMNILEVGGGTASATRNLTRALRSGFQEPVRSLRCNRYDFTDVSSSFLDDARQEFATFSSQMTFKALNMERNFAEQGFQDKFYDVVVADNVLHVTSNLAQTLQNVRKSLKTGGKLVMHELLKPSGWTAGFIFGTFPGWWLGDEEKRALSPNLTTDEWDVMLRENGFSGVDMVFRDWDDEVAHHLGWVVSTAIEERPTNGVHGPEPGQATIVVNHDSSQQKELAEDLMAPLEELLGARPQVLDLEAAARGSNERSPNELVVFLADYGPSFLASLDESKWPYFKLLVEKPCHLLWVSAGGGKSPSPDHGLLDGLARTLRLEYYELHLVTLALDSTDSKTKKTRHLMQVAKEMISRKPQDSYEQEYVEVEGRLRTRRLVEANHVKVSMNEKLMPYKFIPTKLGGSCHFEFSIRSSDSPSSECVPHYVQPPALSTKKLVDDQVEILVKAVSLQPSDRTSLLGREEKQLFGSYCAGVVVTVGPEAAFVPGDRVFAASPGSFRSHVRLSSQEVIGIPSQVPFTDACWVLPPTLTAFHALIDVCRVRHRDSILIHDGASPVGQASLRLLNSQGVSDIWTTAASEEESLWIVDNLGVPQDRILPKAWFDSHPMLLSKWKQKFDIIFSPKSNLTSSLHMEYVRSGGRYVVLQWSPDSSIDAQNIHRTPPSISLSILQPGETPEGSSIASLESLQYAAKSLSDTNLENLRHQASVLPASDLASIITQLQNTDGHKMLVVDLDSDDTVDVRVSNLPTYSLSPSSTYLIAGGLGGLGRSMARWLVSRGARNLILLSRSGPRGAEAVKLLEELAEKGVQIETPPCDVTDRVRLRSVLDDCARRMPPIKGCIQSSMVMKELIFPKLGFEDWKTTIDPKATGSWNLHTELPHDLDFFVLISSMMGVIGTGSLSAYNAANTYQDALAHYRVAQGQKAIALNLGAVPDGGYLTAHSELVATMQKERYEFTQVKDLCALLEVFCDPEASFSSSNTGCQTVVGVRPPAYWKHLEEVPATMAQPLWGHMHHVPLENQGEKEEAMEAVGGRRGTFDTAVKLAEAGSLGEAAEVVSQALATRVSALLGTSEDRMDVQKPMHSYGIDSLSAIDLRNWVGRVFDVDLPVFEILGGATFANAGMSIARKVQLRR